LHRLLFECIDNSINEAIRGKCTAIECMIHKDGSVFIADDGPGISLKLIPDRGGQSFLESVLTQLHVPRNSDRGGYKSQSGHLRGVGLVAVNALSASLRVEVRRDGQVWEMICSQGEVRIPLGCRGTTNQTGTNIDFKPDAEIFTGAEFDHERIRQRLLDLSFLVPGVRLILWDLRKPTAELFYHPEGLSAFVKHQNQHADALFPEVFTHEKEYEGARIAVAFQPTCGFEPKVSSFVNSEPCGEGTHIKGFRAGLWRGLECYGKQHGMFLSATPKIEHYYEGLSAVISVWLEDPYFEGPTRFKLGNVAMAATVAEVVREGIETWAKERPAYIHQWIEKAVAAAEMDQDENYYWN
jgi:DNA gyrase subunit B